MKIIENKSPENIDLRWNKDKTEVTVDGWLFLEIDKDLNVIVIATVLEPIQVESLTYFWYDYVYHINKKLEPIIGLEYEIFSLAKYDELPIEIV